MAALSDQLKRHTVIDIDMLELWRYRYAFRVATELFVGSRRRAVRRGSHGFHRELGGS